MFGDKNINTEEYVSKLEKENEFTKDLLEFYKEDNKKLKKELYNKNNTINSLQSLVNKYNIIKKINLINRIIPENTNRRKIAKFALIFIKKIYKKIKKLIKFIVKIFHKIIPFKIVKRKIVNKVFGSRKLYKSLNIVQNQGTIVDGNQELVLENLTYLNKSIAVHLHLFYTDLAEEFNKYLNNIPYTFDLYISVPYKTNIHKIESEFKKNININKVIVKESENSGRDYGPMFVLFKNELKEYDYVLHIHSKKSLRTGREQSEWRRYLLNNLLGTRELVMKYFNLMENWNVGIAYPRTFDDISYLCHSHLGSINLAREFYKRLELEFKDEYLNFSAGSMFWCKGELLKDLFELDLEWEDFGKDIGQEDGTLEYVLERIWDPLIKKKKMNFASYDNRDNKFYLNYLDINLQDYKSLTKDNFPKILMNYPIISFDIFDTLVTRKVYEPDDNFILLDSQITNRFNLKEGLFFKLRKNAEKSVRKAKNYQGDCSIHEIYEEIFKELSKTTNISYENVLEMKQMEIDNDIKSIIPRKDMLEIYNKLLENNKKIILISDMYYTKEIIEKILNKCGYYDYSDLLVSSEIGLRKDNGTMWEYFYKKYNNTIHVGDNEESDWHKVICRYKAALHIMQGRKMFKMSSYNNDTNEFMENRIMQGLIINKGLFNSPFAINDNKIINTTYNLGYAILGPLFLYYFNWLINSLEENAKLLFVSREGYYLQKIYKHIISKSKKAKELENIYFLISRKAISVPNIRRIEDIKKIFMTQYDGNLKELFYYRLGVMLSNKYNNINIMLPNDIDYVMKIAEENFDLIQENAKHEKENYEKYIYKTVDFSQDKDFTIVDLGYSGTAQFELSKFLNKKISGAYFLVSNNLKPLSIGAKVISCFIPTVYNYRFDENPLGRYSFYLESFLTSPDGQLFNFDEDGNPIFLRENNKKEYMEKLDIIYQGIIDFIDDMVQMNVIDIVDYKLDKEFILKNFENFAENNKHMSNEVTDVLKVEDLYASNCNLTSEDYYV